MVLKNPGEQEKGKTIVYLVRHGDREKIPGYSAKHGHAPNSGLSKLGIKQAKEISEDFKKVREEIDMLYCSSMNRAKETAQIIGKAIGKKPIIYPNLEEIEGIIHKKFFKKIFKWKFWMTLFKLGSAESSLKEILDKNKEKVIVIVAHGTLIKSLVGRKLGLSLRRCGAFECDNCGVAKLRFKLNGKLDWVYCWNSKQIL